VTLLPISELWERLVRMGRAWEETCRWAVGLAVEKIRRQQVKDHAA
jgi:hypothetical protein